MKGKVLAINMGSTSTKVGYYVDGNTVLVRGGAVTFFGTNDLRELERRAADDPKVDTWLDAFGLNVAKYIASLATTEVYPGENELDSLAENGYLILAGETKVHRYDKDRLLDD